MRLSPKSAQPTTSGFQRDRDPLAESRGSASGRVWGSAPSRRSRQHRVSKGTMSLWQSPEAAPLAGFGAAPQIDRRSMQPLGAPQRMNFPTVQWTVGKEVIPHGVGKCREATKGTARSAPCKRGRSLINLISVHKKTERNFPLVKRVVSLCFFIALFKCIFMFQFWKLRFLNRREKRKPGVLGDALSCRASPLQKQSTGLFSDSPLAGRLKASSTCGRPWGAAPNPARGAASGLCQRDIVPLETRCLSAAPIWDSVTSPAIAFSEMPHLFSRLGLAKRT